AETTKREIGAKTADTPLWEGPFLQPRNTKVFSNFAEARTYVYDGREIDTQVHYGYDLASTKHSPVPAANAGGVAFAAPVTTSGHSVIVDHGLGLQTLYAHLSSIDVKVGDKVTRGQELGRTGATGLAIGDHLHFEVLVAGVSVTPLEWWDAKWIRDRVNRPLKEAGLPEIAGVGAVSEDEPPRATPARALGSALPRAPAAISGAPIQLKTPNVLKRAELFVRGQRRHAALDCDPDLVLGADEALAALQHFVGHAPRDDDDAVEIA